MDQRLVVRLQLLHLGHLRGLCVKVKFAVPRTEKVTGGQHLLPDSPECSGERKSDAALQRLT